MRVLIDTDPGGDDAIALLWLASLHMQQRIELRAIFTAGGNVGAHKTWRNAHGLLGLCGLRQIPVARGIDGDRARDAAEVHGADGIGGLAETLPGPPAHPAVQNSAAAIVEHLEAGKETGSLLAVAPLSNLAHAESLAAGTLRRAKQLIVMGGSLGAGNVTPAAEFNFYFDAPAAAAVLAARPASQLVTLETSTTLRLSGDHVAAIISGTEKTPAAIFFSQLCAFMARRDTRFNSRANDAGFPVHDAATVAWLAYPELFTAQERRLRVNASRGPLQGQLREHPEGSPAVVASGVDSPALLERLGSDLRTLFRRLA